MSTFTVAKENLSDTLMRTRKGSSCILFTFHVFDAAQVTYLLGLHKQNIITLSESEVDALKAEKEAGKWAISPNRSRTLSIKLNAGFDEHWCEDFSLRLHPFCESILPIKN